MQDLRDTPLPCLRCGRDLESVDSAHMPTQPYAATVFVAYGQYGSTVFDPSPRSRSFLEGNICDPCVKECAAAGLIAFGTRVPRPDDVAYEVFEPEVEDDDS